MSVKISELPILDSLADNDVIAGVDTSANVTSKIEMATLKNYIDTNTQYTAGTNIDITNNVVSAPNVYNKTETDELLEEKDEQIEELKSEVDSLSMIYNAFPTESGEGESLTLDDTAEVKFKKFDLKGNTSQTTYSGKNLLNLADVSATTTGGITYSISNGVITLNGTASGDWGINLGNYNFPAGDYAYSDFRTATNNNLYTGLTYSNGWQYAVADHNKKTNTTTEVMTKFRIYVIAGTTLNNVQLKPMLVSDTTVPTTYEPYVGGTASPNPSYPQPVNVVSGDNEIVVNGKNFLDLTGITERTISTGVTITPNFNNGLLQNIKISGTPTTTDWQILKRVTLNAGTYILNGLNLTGSQYYGFRFGIYIDSSTQYFVNTNTPTVTFTISESKTVDFVIWVQDKTYYPTTDVYIYPMIRLASETDDTYEPYQGNTYNIDLGGLGKNKFDINSITKGIELNSNTGQTQVNSSWWTSAFIPIKSNQAYTSSNISSNSKCWYDNNKKFISYVQSQTATSPANAKYLRVNGTLASLESNPQAQIEEGNSVTTFEAYNSIELCKIGNYQDYFYKDSDKWYLHKEIGKVVLNGSENWQQSGTYTNNTIYSVYGGVIPNYSYGRGISNLFIWNFNISASTVTEYMATGGDTLRIGVLKSRLSAYTINEFKTWLSNNNVTTYYVLATPTGIEITYQPLIDQLNELEKAISYDSQTNISQVSNDKPFILDVTAIKSLQSVLDRVELLES